MTEQSQEILENFQVRKSTGQKRAFRAWLLVTMEGGERLYVSRQCAAAWREKLRELERSFVK